MRSSAFLDRTPSKIIDIERKAEGYQDGNTEDFQLSVVNGFSLMLNHSYCKRPDHISEIEEKARLGHLEHEKSM